jgi:hypothetical protein
VILRVDDDKARLAVIAKRTWLLIGTATLVLVAVWFLYPALGNRFLQQSPDEISAEFLQKTPIGTTAQDVDAFLKSQGLTYHIWGSGKVGNFVSILGSYWSRETFPFATVIQASWVFDDNGRLQSIKVRKYMDSW